MTNVPEEQKAGSKPPKKTKWYWNVLTFLIILLPFCGIKGLLFQDIPLLLFCGTTYGLLTLPFYWVERPPKYKRWTRRSLLQFLVLLLWIFGSTAGVYALLMFVIPPFAISPQTTYLTEPRSKEFYGIDYQAVIAVTIEGQLDPGVPPTENGFRLLTETFGRPFFGGDTFKDKHWNRLCQYLDLSPELEPKQPFVCWSEYAKTLSEEENEIIKTSSCGDMTFLPWPEEAIPIVRRWIEESNPALDLFVVAAQKPVLYAPPMFDTGHRLQNGLNENGIVVEWRVLTLCHIA